VNATEFTAADVERSLSWLDGKTLELGFSRKLAPLVVAARIGLSEMRRAGTTVGADEFALTPERAIEAVRTLPRSAYEATARSAQDLISSAERPEDAQVFAVLVLAMLEANLAPNCQSELNDIPEQKRRLSLASDELLRAARSLITVERDTMPRVTGKGGEA
jgi:hypothetical protein